MAVQNTRILNCVFPKENLIEVLDVLNTTKVFQPINSSRLVHDLRDVNKVEQTRNYKELLDDVKDVAKKLNLEFKMELTPDASQDVTKTKLYLSEINKKIHDIEIIKNDIIHDKEENEEVISFLDKCTSKNINVEDLLNCSYVTARFGCLENSKLENLQYYLEKPFIFDILKKGTKETWVYYVATNKQIPEIDNIFHALGFKEIEIPKIVHGTNKDAFNELIAEKNAMTEYALQMDGKINLLKDKEEVKLTKIYSSLEYLQTLEEEKEYVVDYLTKFSITGFIFESDIDTFKDELRRVEGVEYTELPSDAISDQDLEVPYSSLNGDFLRTFEKVSKPIEGRRDMTIGFAILYLAVFALCFGDYGLGACLLAFGLFKKKKLSLYLGLAALVGGILYGTCFYVWSLSPQYLPVVLMNRLVGGIVILFVGKFILNLFKK